MSRHWNIESYQFSYVFFALLGLSDRLELEMGSQRAAAVAAEVLETLRLLSASSSILISCDSRTGACAACGWVLLLAAVPTTRRTHSQTGTQTATHGLYCLE